jgi:hypothetical protein
MSRPKWREGRNWTEAHKEILRAMALTHPVIEIAKALGPGFNKNMVIGKCRRMNIELEWWPNLSHAQKAAVIRPPRPSVGPKRKSRSKYILPTTPVEKHWKPSGLLARCGGWASGWY